MHTRWQLAVLLTAALVIRLAAGAWWQARQTERFGFPDSESYWVLAGHLARGEPYQFGPEGQVFRTPGYPWLLSIVFRFTGDGERALPWARGLSAVLGTLAVGGVYWLGREIQGHRVAMLAACWAALSPEAVGWGVFLLSEAPFCPLLAAQLALWVKAWRQPHANWAHGLALAAGMAAGAASLMRPSWLLFTPLAVGLSLLLDRRRLRQLTLGLAIGVGLMIVMTPWWVRNFRVTGHFVPTTLQVGASLFDGLNPAADGSSNMRPGQQAAEHYRATEQPAGNVEYALDGHLKSAACSWAREHPRRVLELAVVKFLRMWNVWPNEPGLRSLPMRLAVLLSYLPLMLLALAGVWRTRKLAWPMLLLWLPAAYFTLLHTVFVSSIRYRQPALLPLAVLAATVLSDLTKGKREGERLEDSK